ncbi:SIMPL domain-containing protein [Streptomyces mirabilis]|nr:SIMPL domain-containing protein [Streptomyces mirabilis]
MKKMITVVALAASLGMAVPAANAASFASPAAVATASAPANPSGADRVADTAVVRLGVEKTAPTASEAVEEAAATTRAVLDALSQAGVVSADIQTSGVSLERIEQRNPVTGMSELLGYRASRSLTVTIRDIKRTGVIIDQAVAAGGDGIRFNGVSLFLSEEQSVPAP